MAVEYDGMKVIIENEDEAKKELAVISILKINEKKYLATVPVENLNQEAKDVTFFLYEDETAYPIEKDMQEKCLEVFKNMDL